MEFSDAVDLIDGLPFSDLIEPALEITGQPRHHDVRQSALFEKAEKSGLHKSPNQLAHSGSGAGLLAN